MKRNSGQISILIITSIIPLLTLFAFVVNVGVLVNAKISLQNAADLAAYAGAATQARQLTHIAHLNYQMRQVYKKFLTRYYVLGNMSLKTFPGGGNNPNPGSGPYNWQNSPNPGFPGMPVVCINLSTESNPCQLAESLPTLQASGIPCIPIEGACNALKAAADAIGRIQGAACEASSIVDVELLSQWLYSTAYDQQISSNQSVQGLISDIGLIPENLLLRSRIETVLGYINAPGNEKVSKAAVGKLENVPDQALNERTVLAMKTVLGNLNPRVFDEDSITMKELLPSTPMLRVKEIKPKFDTAAIEMLGVDNGNQPVPAGVAPAKCLMKMDFTTAQPIVGVKKDGNDHVYYAVKVTARARLLFNPFPFGNPAEDIELTAYAAAAPFGSRIGPDLQEADFVKTLQAKDSNGGAVNGFSGSGVTVPTLKVSDDVSWDSSNYLASLFTAMRKGDPNAIATGAVTPRDIERVIRNGTLPEESELGRYDIPVDVDRIGEPGKAGHEFVPYYKSDGAAVPLYTFWAPMFGEGGQGALIDNIKKELENVSLFAGVGSGNTTSVQNTRTNLAQVLSQGITQLIGQMRQPGGDASRKGVNFISMPDPLSQSFSQSNPLGATPPGKVTDVLRIATAYSTDHDGGYFENGRSGYSVKFMPLKSIFTKPGLISNLNGDQTWLPVRDTFKGDAAEITGSIEH